MNGRILNFKGLFGDTIHCLLRKKVTILKILLSLRYAEVINNNKVRYVFLYFILICIYFVFQ